MRHGLINFVFSATNTAAIATNSNNNCLQANPIPRVSFGSMAAYTLGLARKNACY